MLPQIKSTLPDDVRLELLADQSVYVRATIDGVIREGVLAACLTAMMILLFLGSWRSTIIVAISIPLSVLTSIIALWATGETLNVMTLGGLALAVGILVDDATVAVENIHRNIELGLPLRRAIIAGAQQIAIPAFVSTLSICIVFLPIFALSGPAAALFKPLALAVIFAMAASYFLSRTLVPTMTDFMLPGEMAAHAAETSGRPNWFRRFFAVFDRAFERFRGAYHALLAGAMAHRRAVLIGGGAFVVLSLALVPAVGEDFFPQVDGGQFQLHVRAPSGTRLEETELLFAKVEQTVRRVIPPSDLALMLDNIGLTTYGVALAVGSNATVGPADGDMLVQLKPDHRGSTWDYVRALRTRAPTSVSGGDLLLPAGGHGEPGAQPGAAGADRRADRGTQAGRTTIYARALAHEIAKIPGAVDVRVQQVMDAPELRYDRGSDEGAADRAVAARRRRAICSSRSARADRRRRTTGSTRATACSTR